MDEAGLDEIEIEVSCSTTIFYNLLGWQTMKGIVFVVVSFFWLRESVEIQSRAPEDRNWHFYLKIGRPSGFPCLATKPSRHDNMNILTISRQNFVYLLYFCVSAMTRIKDNIVFVLTCFAESSFASRSQLPNRRSKVLYTSLVITDFAITSISTFS